MKISKQEQLAVQNVVTYGREYGFGNLIAHLRSAWAVTLMERYGMDERDAMIGAGGNDGYPIAMHRDLMERGEWDETGARYSLDAEAAASNDDGC